MTTEPRPRRKAARGGAPAQRLSPRTTWIAVLMCLASMISVQSGVALSVPILHEYGVLSTSSLRLVWAASVLMILVRPPLLHFSRAQWRAALLLGSAMAMMTLTFFLAIDRLPQHLTVAIEFCGPLTVAAIGLRSARAVVWPALAAVGIVLLVWGQSHHQDVEGVDALGIVFALAAATGWGLYIVLMKRVGTAFQGLQGLALSLSIAAVLALPLGMLEIGTPAFPPAQWLWAGGLAVMVPLIPYVLEINALRRLSAAAFGVLLSLSPALAALAGWVFLGQTMSTAQLLGSLLVVVASLGVTRQGAG